MPSKLGPHFNYERDSDAMLHWLETTRPAVALAVNPNPAFWQEAKRRVPEMFCIGRKHYFNPQPWTKAGQVAGGIRDMSAAHIMDAWVGLNEPSRSRLGNACRLDRDVAITLKRSEINYLCGSWSVGVPDITDWEKGVMHEAIREAYGISVHEYSAPTMNFPLGMDPDGSGWFTMRYRKWYPRLPDDCQKPLYITECGIDSGAPHWDAVKHGGWQAFCSAEDYVAQLAWYDSQLQQDAYVKGACIYQWGSLDKTWDTYDFNNDLCTHLRNYIRSQQGEQPPPPPPPATNWQSRALAAENKLRQIRSIATP